MKRNNKLIGDHLEIFYKNFAKLLNKIYYLNLYCSFKNCFVSPSKSALNRKSCDESDVKRQKSSNNNAKLASSQTVSKSLELSSDGNSSLKDSNGKYIKYPITLSRKKSLNNDFNISLSK